MAARSNKQKRNDRARHRIRRAKRRAERRDERERVKAFLMSKPDAYEPTYVPLHEGDAR